MQLKTYARQAGVSVSEVKKCLRRSRFASDDRDYASPETELTSDEVKALETAKANGVLRRNPGVATTESGVHHIVEPGASSTDIDDLPSAQVSSALGQARAEGAHAIYIHLDVLAWLEEHHGQREQRRVFTRRVQELMAHGRATRMKGTKGANEGWLRTPLGGNSGYQYYLWLIGSGDVVRRQTEAAKALHACAPTGARFLRAIRHHDDTPDALDVGRFDDYMLMSAERVLEANDDNLLDPLVESQSVIVSDRTRVRVLVGQPGAGKTTTLHAAASRLTGRALYITWSHDLAMRAKEWFSTFAPRDLEVVVWTYKELLSHVDPALEVANDPSLPFAVEHLCRCLKLHMGQLGPWRRDGRIRAEELFAEFQAHLVGAALPVRFRERSACETPHLSDTDYRALRRHLGAQALEGASLAWSKLTDSDKQTLFPSVMAAFDRALRLQRDELALDPEVFSFDWVLVDEVQDLTVIEAWLLLDVTARSGRARGVKPGMVIAGDEAQTVRPTAFEFGALANLTELRLGARTDRREHPLVANLRSPETIAITLDRSRDILYHQLPRGQRPRGPRPESPADVTVGRVMLVNSPDEHLADVFDLFAANPAECALVFPGAQIPPDIARLAKERGAHVWNSETIKGLEFRIVGVLNVPAEIARIEGLAASAARDPLAVELARYSIDRFIVACSRSTETLVLVGDAWATSSSKMLECLSQGGEPVNDTSDDGGATAEGFMGFVSAAVLASVLEVDAADAVLQIDSLLEQSERRDAMDEHDVAIALARNAVGLLGRAGRPGSAGPERRRRVHARLAHALVLDALTGDRLDQLREASRSFVAAGEPALGSTLTSLRHVLTKSLIDADVSKRLAEVAFTLPEVAKADGRLGGAMVTALLTRVRAMTADEDALPPTRVARATALRALSELSTSVPFGRDDFRAGHKAVLHRALHRAAGQRDKSSTDEYVELRRLVEDTVEGAIFDAERDEARGEFRSAAQHWETAIRPADALRCARAMADFATAARLATKVKSDDAPGLEWARDVMELVTARPPGALSTVEQAAILAKTAHALGTAEQSRQVPS